jgi:ABC-type multidrug transport system fused ATPase/permease subunit
MAQAMKIADRLYLLDKGRLVAQGSPERLLSDSSGLAARLLEASGVTLPPARP